MAIEGNTRICEHDILSYSTKDRDQVVELAEALAAPGIRPWLNVWDLVPACPWLRGTERGLKGWECRHSQDQEVMALIRHS